MKKYFLLFTVLLFLGSCTKDRRLIRYHADVVFFYYPITANELNGYTDLLWGPIDRLDYYIVEDGEEVFVGSEYPGPAYVSAGKPDCYAPTYVTSSITWYNQNYTFIDFRVYGVHEALLGKLETFIDGYSFDLYANECAAVEISFPYKKKE